MLQTEVARLLTRIASTSSEQTQSVVEAGAVTVFIKLIESSNPNICEQAVCALEIIIGDAPIRRNYVLRQDVIAPLLTLLERNEPVSVDVWN